MLGGVGVLLCDMPIPPCPPRMSVEMVRAIKVSDGHIPVISLVTGKVSFWSDRLHEAEQYEVLTSNPAEWA